jgi:hypothetical protein
MTPAEVEQIRGQLAGKQTALELFFADHHDRA